MSGSRAYHTLVLLFDMRIAATASAMLLFSLSLFLGHPSSVGGAQDQEGTEDTNYEQQGVAHNDVFASAQLHYMEDTDAVVALQHPSTLQSNTFIAYNVLQTNEQTRTDIVGHSVSRGETLSSIAEQYGIAVQTLLWANDMDLSDTLPVGSVITVLPVNGALHIIDDNETLSDIAQYYDVDIQDILHANDIEDSEFIFSGQQIIIPGAKRKQTEALRSDAISTSQGLTFARPAEGVLSQGLHRYNAIDIANQCGSPIYSSMSGIVDTVAGGNRWNGGYGNYLTIHHRNGIQTLYAHLSTIVAVPGQTVRQGEMIGYMGTTGRSTGCHVHFEVRGATNPVR